MGIAALAGALPSLVVIGLPVYAVGNIAMGDPFFLSGSLPLFAGSLVVSVLANAALVEMLSRRRTDSKTPDGVIAATAE
jgi:hypothetical protein